jgi:ABC-2 type transport system permease protein
VSKLSEIVASRELITNLTLRELRSRYKRSVLGWAWSMLNPLSTVVIYTLVFKYFFKADGPKGDPSGLKNFSIYLFVGLTSWNFFSASTGRWRRSWATPGSSRRSTSRVKG